MTAEPERLLTRESAAVQKHSIVIAGHPTSISLEEAFWMAFKTAAARRGMPVAALAAEIDTGRGRANLSSAIRVFLLAEAQRPDKPGSMPDT